MNVEFLELGKIGLINSSYKIDIYPLFILRIFCFFFVTFVIVIINVINANRVKAVFVFILLLKKLLLLLVTCRCNKSLIGHGLNLYSCLHNLNWWFNLVIFILSPLNIVFFIFQIL